MTEHTTIQLTTETKEQLESEQLPKESFDDTVSRLLGESDGSLWTEEEIRSVVRQETRNVLREMNR